jgi:hypothetical protein
MHRRHVERIREKLRLDATASIHHKRLKKEDAEALVAKLNTDHPDLDKPAARLLYQHAGERVTVPPGWVHMVHNMQNCVKLAFDLLHPANFPAYIESWQQVAIPYMGNNSTRDYMGVNCVLADSLQRYWRTEETARRTAGA